MGLLYRKRFRLSKWLSLNLSKSGVRLLLLGFLLYLLSGCGFAQWRDQTLRDVAEGRWHVIPEQVPAGGAPSQTVEFYDAAGRHVGYGKVQGGSVEFFNPDGSRAGFGKR